MFFGSHKDEADTREEHEEEENDGRVAHRETKTREEELHDAPTGELADGANLQRKFGVGGLLAVEGRGWIAAPQIDTITGYQDAGGEKKYNLVGLNPIDYKTDGKGGKECIEQVAQDGTQSGEESGNPSFVQGSLYHQNASWPHRG